MKRKGESGQVIPLVALSLTVLMGAGGMAVDHGYWQYAQRQQQNAADSAAIGGAQALSAPGCNNQSIAQAAAQSDAASNGFASTQVTANNPPQSGPYASNTCAVQVTVTGKYPKFFTQIFGLGQLNESTTATALLVNNSNTTAIMLGGNNTNSTITGNINGPTISFETNGTFTCGSNTINVASIGYAGNSPSCTSAKFTGGTPQQQWPVVNPCPSIAGCNYLTNNPPSTTNCTSLKANMNDTLSPGCYNAFTVGGCGTVKLNPGVYVLNGTSSMAGTSFTGSGVTFYVTANATPPDFSSAQSAVMTPPTSGNETGVLYYQVPANTKAPDFSGSSVNWSGLVYAPTATGVNFNGAKGNYTLLIVGSANLNDSSGYTFAAPPTGGSLIENVVLAQ
jgi:hypothetical protein